MFIKKISIISFILMILSTNILFAQRVNKESNSELTVEADESLEWFEKEKYYLAKGNVLLKKNGLILKANMVKANYVIENKENILNKIIAKNKVILIKDKAKATGQYMTYDTKKKIAFLSGPFQTFTSPSGYVESKKTLMFDDLKHEAEAVGKVKIILKNKTVIYADKVKAYFITDDKSLNKAVAIGNVIIENKLKEKTSKADLGIYNSSSETVKLEGNVVIINQDSSISGAKGITNLKTGVSNIIGDRKNKKRVKGVFAPIKKQNKGD